MSNVISLYEHMNAYEKEKSMKHNRLSQWLSDRVHSETLRTEVLEYYEYILSHRYLRYERSILLELPSSTRMRLVHALFPELTNVKLFMDR